MSPETCADLGDAFVAKFLPGPGEVTAKFDDGAEYDIELHAPGGGACTVERQSPRASYPDSLSLVYALGDLAYFPDNYDSFVTDLGFGDFDSFTEVSVDGWDVAAYRLNASSDISMVILIDSEAMFSCRQDTEDSDAQNQAELDAANGLPTFSSFCSEVRDTVVG